MTQREGRVDGGPRDHRRTAAGGAQDSAEYEHANGSGRSPNRVNTYRYVCPLCEKRALDVTEKGHRDGGARTVLVHCFACGAGAREVSTASNIAMTRLLRWPPPDELGVPQHGDRHAIPVGPSISKGAVAGSVSALWSRDHAHALAYLKDTRGLTNQTIRDYEVGYSISGDAIVFPIRDEAGEVVGMKRRFLDPAADPKTVNSAGPARLYPIQVLASDPSALVLCEGEFDALVLNQHGIPAITGTAGTHWKPEWSAHLIGRNVAVMYDAGSFALATDRAAQLKRDGARRAWPVDLILAGFKEGDDATDWFVRYDRSASELRSFVNSAWRTRRAAA